jgi:hypothetical protein
MIKSGDLVEVIPDNKNGLRHGTTMDKADCLHRYYVYYGTILLVTGDAFTTETGNRQIQVLHPDFGLIKCNENAVKLISR